jgi:ABC-2 type transport system ATP-binding protein
VGFHVPQGKTLAIIGHNGAGKTTLFHLILGLKFRDRGAIEIRGQDAQSPAARSHVGFVPERPYLNLELTLRKTLHYLGELSGISRASLSAKVEKAAREVELDAVLDQPLKTYSKGMLQRTLIAQAMLHDPSLLVLDEPMSGLDPEAREFLKNKIKEWKAGGKSVLFSSHVIEDVNELADLVGVLDSGRLTFFGPVQEWSAK